MIKILQIGSNFGLSHLKAAENIKNFKINAISSPNINKKKIKKNINTYKSYQTAIKKEKPDIILLATPPKIQEKILNFILKNDISLRAIFLEKPVSTSYFRTKDLIKKLKKKKILFLVNFIFTQLNCFKKMIKLYNFKKIKELNYNWHFRQSYFENKINTWKIRPSEGGGLVNYYLIHIFYNLLCICKNISIKKIFFKRKKILDEIFIICRSGRKIININLNINSPKRVHELEFVNNDNTIDLISNKTKDWTKNFYFNKYKNLDKKNASRVDLTEKNLSLLKKYVLDKKNFNNIGNYYHLVLNAHSLCGIVLKKLNND